MKKNRKTFYVCIIAFIVIINVGYLFYKNNLSAERQLKVIYVPKILDNSNDFWSELISGAKMAAKEYDVDLEIVGPDSEDDIERQGELVDYAISQKPDVLVISPSDYERSVPYVKRVKESGIKLVLIDSRISGDFEDAVVHTDNFMAGRRIGEYILPLITGDTKIGIVGHVQNASTAIEREGGLRDGLGSAQDKIIDVVFCDSDYDKAYNLTKEMYANHPDLNILVGLNEYSALGAARAVRDMGIGDKICMVGFDSSIEEIQMLEQGIVDAIVIQKAFNMGYLGIQKAVQIAGGSTSEYIVDSGSVLITKENMYEDENQKLLFPFWSTAKEESQGNRLVP